MGKPLPKEEKAPLDSARQVEPLEEKKPLVQVIREEPKEGLQITWKDGLPDDPFERMQIETGLIGAGLTSKHSAIKRLLDGDEEAAEAEMRRIEEEQQANQMAEAAMGMQIPPPQDQQEAQETREQMNVEREEKRKLDKELAKKKAEPPSNRK